MAAKDTAKGAPPPAELRLALPPGHQDGPEVIITVRRSAQAVRMSLRVDAMNDGFVLVLPLRANLRDGKRFVDANQAWIAERLAALPPRRPFVAGAKVPLLGEDHLIHHQPAARRGVWREPGMILVSGQADHLARRLQDFLKAEARRIILPRVEQKAAHLQTSFRRVTLRDTRSRWGSCSSAGDLAFSWRLVLAPEWVLDYVVAHEVAHLREMNHSPRFWQLVAKISPDAAPARQWLKAHGAGLHRVG